MKIYTKTTKNGNKWQLVCDNWETSNAWGHEVTPIRNGYDYDKHKCRYYNRTWEMYAYQSCMSGAIEEIYQDKLNMFIENYKEKNEIARFKKGQKEEIIKLFEEEEIAKELKEVKEAINNREFD